MSSPRKSSNSRGPSPLWRSLDADAIPRGLRGDRQDEFPDGASLWPTELGRRDFIKLLGGSLALAGLSSCGARPKKIVPRTDMRGAWSAAESSFYATAMPLEGYARGVIVEAHQGRPTKIEGNPEHPDSLGATDAMTQAAVLALYDPDRSRAPRRAGQISNWETFQSEWLTWQREFTANRGRGLAVLTEPTTSPTELREIERALDALPEAQWFQHTSLARYDIENVQPDFDFSVAEVIFSIGADFLYRHPSALRYSRQFATRRRVTDGHVALNRLYAVDTSPTVTSAIADVRLPLAPSRTRALLNAIAHSLEGSPSSNDATLTQHESAFVAALARDLRTHGAKAICVAGAEQDLDVQRWALAMNARLGSSPGAQRFLPAVRSDSHARASGSLPELAETMARGELRTLLILGSNPAYTAPADLDFAQLIARVPTTVHLGSYFDETAAQCLWHIPESHFLETWSDLRAFDGTATLLQPLIEPRFRTRSCGEIIRQLRDPNGIEAYDLVRETWHERVTAADFESLWFHSLRRGVVENTASVPAPYRAPAVAELTPPTDSTLTLTFQPDAKVLDGRFANNPWLQELPHPVTQLVWDNAVSVSPAFAKGNGLATGDLIVLSFAGSRAPENPFPPPKEPLTAAVLVVPGQAADCLTLSLGYGRSRAGSQGTGRGFNAGQLRTTDHRWQISPVSIRKAGSRYPLVTTQEHFSMEDRDPVRRVTPENLQVERPSLPSLYPAWPREGYAWAMSIDLSTCTGCKACVVACQAENNIPSVGKDQVARGREMHWLRVDRYYSGDPANPHMFAQPVPCMHCENAPCELVCPVAATVHSSEGLNDMIYNRCIGTRYCSNNCPYKVRRFNFLDYRASSKSPVHLQDNPDVTVRERGVMEKCTYCVQRINAARIAAEKENRRVRDGEIKTACQQACPVEAIVFGDLNDPDSLVNRRKKEPVDYALLAELNTRPRTTYLAKVIAELDDPFATPGDDTRSTDMRQATGDGLARISTGGPA